MSLRGPVTLPCVFISFQSHHLLPCEFLASTPSLFSLIHMPTAPCNDPEWTLGGNRCYRFFNKDGLSYPEMRATCQQAGGDLARIDNTQQDALAQFLAGKSRAFIGLTDRVKEGQFTWTDGTSPIYSNWSPGEPNDYLGKEDCTVINWHGNSWNDVKCTSNDASEGFVCSAEAPRPGYNLEFLKCCMYT